VVTHIDCAADESAALGICAGNDQVLTSHHIPLESSCDQSVDVLTHWDEHFACKMAALLSTVQLILKVNGRRAILCK
jgi:phosphoribosylformylglycinamidine (FGAM) synthase-like amidotransferase family enzyme